MKKHTAYTMITAISLAALLMAVPCRSSENEGEAGRRDGERFEETIMLEGMEETVRYEHVRCGAVGFGMDFDYELFERRSEPDRELFVSTYDDPEDPQNYLEVTFSAGDADSVSASVCEAISDEYEFSTEPDMLERAGSCIRIDASRSKDGGMPDLLQTVYIIPADRGCIVAAAHFTLESAEGFGVRMRGMMDTLAVIDRHEEGHEEGLEEGRPAGMWQTASMGYEVDGTMQPEYYVQFTDTEIIYGHMKDGSFVPDHSDTIISAEETAAGGLKIRAESASGVQYTYQTSEGDMNVLEYYETWQEEEFPDMYRGGASLSAVAESDAP